MRTHAPVVAAAALLLTVASAAISPVLRQSVPALGGPEIPDADRTCTKSGEKCAGAPNFNTVVFKGCCDNRLICAFPKDIPTGLWGRFCILQSQASDEAATTTTTATTAADSDATTAADGAATTAAADDDDSDSAGGVAVGGSTDDDADADADADSSADESDDAAGVVDDDDADPSSSDDDDATASSSDADESPDASEDDDDDGSVCFPADATVELKDGSVVPMSKVSVGDMVKVGVDTFSPVFMFTHKMADVSHKFVTLETATGAALSLTSGHYLYADGALVAASQVKVGSTITLGSGVTDTVVNVGSKTAAGLYNPQTIQGNVVVNNVVASTYTTAVEPTFAHAILAPFRFFNSFGLTLTSFESGGGVFADVAPRGQSAF